MTKNNTDKVFWTLNLQFIRKTYERKNGVLKFGSQTVVKWTKKTKIDLQSVGVLAALVFCLELKLELGDAIKEVWCSNST